MSCRDAYQHACIHSALFYLHVSLVCHVVLSVLCCLLMSCCKPNRPKGTIKSFDLTYPIQINTDTTLLYYIHIDTTILYHTDIDKTILYYKDIDTTIPYRYIHN